MANFGYVFYGIIFFRWEYELVHFAPPIFLWIFMLTNMHEYDDSVNYLTKGYLATAWALLSGVLFTMMYQHISMPVEVYKNEMRYMFMFATVGVSLAEYVTMIIWSFARAIWLQFLADEKVRQFYWGNRDTETQKNK
jgi:signal transduction histidine kinase